MEDRAGFERIGACEVNAVRHLLVASPAKGDCAIRGGLVIKEVELVAGLKPVMTDARPRPHGRAAEKAPTAGVHEGPVLQVHVQRWCRTARRTGTARAVWCGRRVRTVTERQDDIPCTC